MDSLQMKTRKNLKVKKVSLKMLKLSSKKITSISVKVITIVEVNKC